MFDMTASGVADLLAEAEKAKAEHAAAQERYREANSNLCAALNKLNDVTKRASAALEAFRATFPTDSDWHPRKVQAASPFKRPSSESDDYK